MAFGITRKELYYWKKRAEEGEIAFLTHFWYDDKFFQYSTITKVACVNKEKLIDWGKGYGLRPEWIHDRKDYPHFDLFGETQIYILKEENEYEQLLKLERRRMRRGKI